MSAPLAKPVAKMNTPKPPVTPPVIIISDEETKEIPDPFPFPATYSANVDIALHRGKQLSYNKHTTFSNCYVYTALPFGYEYKY